MTHPNTKSNDCGCELEYVEEEGDGYLDLIRCTRHDTPSELIQLLRRMNDAFQAHGTPKFLHDIRNEARRLLRKHRQQQ